MEEFVEEIGQELPPCAAKATYSTLAKVLGNIMREPSEPKFRTLKKENKMVAENICSSLAAHTLLVFVGFEDQDTVYHCPMTTDLDRLKVASQLLQDRTMDLDMLSQLSAAAASDTPAAVASASPAEVAPDPGAASKPAPGTLLPRAAPRKSETEKQRAQQAEQLQALRAARLQKDRAAAGGDAVASTANAERPTAAAAEPARPDGHPPDLDLLTGDVSEEAAAADGFGVDLLTGGPPAATGDPLELEQPSPVQDADAASGTSSTTLESKHAKKPAKTLYDFEKRDRGEKQQQAAESLEEMRRLQRERFQQFKTDPGAKTSEVYARPPSGMLDPNYKPPAPSVATSAKSQAAGKDSSSWSSWIQKTTDTLSSGLNDTSSKLSQGLTDTSEKLKGGMNDASARLSTGFSNVQENLGLSGWGFLKSSPADEAVGKLPARFEVVGAGGAVVRAGSEKNTANTGTLPMGAEFIAVEVRTATDGSHRLRLEAPLKGWLTARPGLVERALVQGSTHAYMPQQTTRDAGLQAEE